MFAGDMSHFDVVYVRSQDVAKRYDRSIQDAEHEKYSIPEWLVSTVNCQTLRPADKRQIFQEQFLARSVHLAGLQEARRQYSGMWEDDDFIYAATQCDGYGHTLCAMLV